MGDSGTELGGFGAYIRPAASAYGAALCTIRGPICRSPGTLGTGSSGYKVTALLSVRSEYYGGDDGGMSDRREGVRGSDTDTGGPRTWS